MSGPYRYQPDAARSPLDRRPQMPLPAQPVSFKTNVNRAKTKKWVEAKKNAYDGDDWGDYDEYDEYGAADQEPPLSARRNSFEAGGEQRAFSASTGYASPTSPSQPHVHAALRQGSGAHADGSDAPHHQRSFSPSAMPPPLNTRMSPAPAGAAASPSTRFPPRKSSIGQAEASAVVSPRDRAPTNPEKPLPFIRPADIYKRFQEEKKEQDRVSLDGQHPAGEEATSHQTLADAQHSPPSPKDNSLSVDSDLRSVVDHAFTRADDQRSVPPTPVTKSDSSVSRSNTSSTTGISPIMSRVPSSATSALKARNAAGGDGSTPVIAEEASEGGTPVSRPTSAALLGGTYHNPPTASPSHSRNASGSSLVGSGLMTPPNASGSPARSPVITPQSHIPEAERAEFFPPARPSGDLGTPADATVREADIVEAMRTNSTSALPELSAAEKESQTAFLETHRALTPVGDTDSRPRSDSPSKGRVQELAGKFGDVSHSRRGSTQSDASRTSVQSWERSGGNSRPASPTKSASPSRDALGARPPVERDPSFRPQLPGQWESYATSAASPIKEHDTYDPVEEIGHVSSSLGQVDLTPTTVKHSVVSTDPSKSDSSSTAGSLPDPLAALRAAGAAVGEAVQSSIGLGLSPVDEARQEQMHGNVLPQPLHSYRTESFASTVPPTPPPKDVTEFVELPPPPPLKERTRESQRSSVHPERPVVLPQLSTDMADDDQESDRLRKEIVASLSPQPTFTGSAVEQDPVRLVTSHDQVGRESALSPGGYDSYGADNDRTVSQPSRDQVQNDDPQKGQSAGTPSTSESLTQSSEVHTKPSILTRFSWEQGSGSGLLISKLQPPTIATSPEDVGRKDTEEDFLALTANDKAAEEQEITKLTHPHPGPSPATTAIGLEPTIAVNSSGHSPIADQTGLASDESGLDLDVSPSPVIGLHVVNSALHPEAVELPPRLSREISPLSDQFRPTEHAPAENAIASSHDSAIGSASIPVVNDPLHNVGEAAVSPNVVASPTSDRPLGFRDILQFRSPSERISNYNKTRDYWAHADHGLGNWISTTLEKKPDLATQPYPQSLPNLNASGTIRHKATGSISLFGKHHGSGSVQAESPNSSTQSPTTPISGSTFHGGGRSASHQMQAKGKDFLHTAGVLSGKGMTGAKGLFAKGKSRFKSEKATSEQGQSSREASEELSDIGSTESETLARVSFDTADSPHKENGMKHRRGFPSAFRRSSRSTSRPISITTWPNIESAPRSTLVHSRPQSYHPPETWNDKSSTLSGTPSVRDAQISTSGCLGVLPSPARSAFSWNEIGSQGQVSHTPPVANDVDMSHRLLASPVVTSTPSQLSMLDVDPMIAPVVVTSETSVSSENGQPTPVTLVQIGHREDKFSYETGLIGQDLSPVSSHTSYNKEKTPTGKDTPSNPDINFVGTSEPIGFFETTLSRDQAATNAGAPEPAPRPKPKQQLSAYRVVHAVEYSHSQSSFESSEQESIETASQSSRCDARDAELLLPPPSPSCELHISTINEASNTLPSELDDKSTVLSVSHSMIPTKSDTLQAGAQQSPDPTKLITHKRSESLISKISSIVSIAGTPISPVSSDCLPRSHPASTQARWRQIPSARTSPIPAQIQEEPNAPDRTINTAVDSHDFDLYADHNGVVRDLQDEEGRPLRVLTEQPPEPAATLRRPSAPNALKYIPLSTPMEDAAGRYSDERPMSFVWGPRDANGRPQDEINRPAGSLLDTPPPLPNTRIQRSSQVLKSPDSYVKTQRSRGPSNAPLLGQASQSDLGSKNVSPLSSYRESTKSSFNSTASPPTTSHVSSPPQRPSHPGSMEAPESGNIEPQYIYQGSDSLLRSPDPRLLQDPRATMEEKIRELVPGQPFSQDSRLSAQLPNQRPQMPGNMLAAARNQYEFQQMLARQAMQYPETQSSTPRELSAKREDRSFKPKLSSMFKGLGKPSSSTTQPSPALLQPTSHQIQQSPTRSPPIMGNMMEDSKRYSSRASGASDHEPSQTKRLDERGKGGLESAPNRPSSTDQGSQISQESMRVQATDSYLDLRYRLNAPLSQSISSQQPPQEVFQHDLNSSMPGSASNAKMIDTSGKKKRFSALGNIFNRNSTTSTGLYVKPRLGKGGKKELKNQKHLAAVPLQPVPQDRPLLLQQPGDAQRYTDTLHGPSPAARPGPGDQDLQSHSVTLRTMAQQAAMPFSSEHQQQRSISTAAQQGTPLHIAAQQYTRSSQIHSSQGVSEGSAYMDTRHFAQNHAQRMQEQIRLSGQQSPHPSYQDHGSTSPELFSNRHYPEDLSSPPVNEYFKPDLKAVKPLPPIQQQRPTQNYYHLQRNHQIQTSPGALQQTFDSGLVSSSLNSPIADSSRYELQRQVNQPPDEPKYDTPPIPDAYTHVSGAFVSPPFDESLAGYQSPHPSQQHRGHYPDSRMQPILPRGSVTATSQPNSLFNTSDSVLTPTSNPLPAASRTSLPLPDLNSLGSQMSRITEQVQPERSWNLNLPQGATEQEIVRARQRQYMEQQLLAQEQLHAERTGHSPSPRSRQSNQSTSPPPPPTEERPSRQESGGFRELLPRSSPRPYPVTSQVAGDQLHASSPHSPSPPTIPETGLASNHSPAAYPLPTSPDPVLAPSPVNPMADMMSPPPIPERLPQTPMASTFLTSRASRPISQGAASDNTHDSLYDPPPPAPVENYQHSSHLQQPDFDDVPPADELPPYSGPVPSNEGFEKERPRPPNIVTAASERSQNHESRQRQASLGLLQHPQPASMAASPQRSSADMGADILRRQLLEAEERERHERLHRAEMQRQESAREKKERERARARARELERSVSGGGRVGSLRITDGSSRVSTNGFERGTSMTRPVYELPAEEDDEPVMRATSFPGQEWVPTWTED